MIRLSLSAVLVAFFAVGCSDGEVEKHKRDPAFFNRMVNTSEHFHKAEEKLPELKLLVSNEKYNMRYALFDNGKFFYQVDNLGKGTGTWTFKNGSLNLFASRTFFAIDIDLVATEAEGDGMAMQFMDRFGNNTVRVQFRDQESSKPLPRFSSPSPSLF